MEIKKIIQWITKYTVKKNMVNNKYKTALIKNK